MAPEDTAASPPARPWWALSLAAAVLAHGPAVAGGLLDADRALIVHNPEIRSFGGLAATLSDGIPILRAAGLSVRDRAPLAVLSTWLGWQWLRADPLLQHALGLACLLAVVLALGALLDALRVPPVLACVAALALALHPAVADVTGPVLGRPAILAAWAALFGARRAASADARGAALWSAGAALAAGLLAAGWGMLGLVPAAVVSDRKARRIAAGAALLGGVATLAIDRAPLPSPGAAIEGAGAVLSAWLPRARPFVIGTAGGLSIVWLAILLALAAALLHLASREPEPPTEPASALLRAGAAAILASLFASAASVREGTVAGDPALALQLGLVLALAGIVIARPQIRAAARPWMLAAFLVPAAVTAIRARAWADEDRVLEAIGDRGPEDPEALLARARLALRRERLTEAAPWCTAYREARPADARADGCLAAVAIAGGQEGDALPLLQRWAARFDDRRALRLAVLELAEAQLDPRFAAVFQKATGFTMPKRRPGEHK